MNLIKVTVFAYMNFLINMFEEMKLQKIKKIIAIFNISAQALNILKTKL